MLKKYKELLNINNSFLIDLFNKVEHPWEVLPLLKDYVLEIITNLDNNYIKYDDNVYIHKDAKIAKSACILGPTIICKGAEIRHCAYIRGNVIIGEKVVIGNSTEIKNAILFNNAKCPHFNYVGDSILGENSHLGAGVIISNVKNDKKNINIKFDIQIIDTKLKKFGAIIGNNVEIGCNSVICPGTIIYPNTDIYPLTRVRGVIGPNKIVKDIDNIVDKN